MQPNLVDIAILAEDLNQTKFAKMIERGLYYPVVREGDAFLSNDGLSYIASPTALAFISEFNSVDDALQALELKGTESDIKFAADYLNIPLDLAFKVEQDFTENNLSVTELIKKLKNSEFKYFPNEKLVPYRKLVKNA